MPRASKLAVGALLLVSSGCVAWPLYIESLWFEGGQPPQRTAWAGAPLRFGPLEMVVIVPGFWTFAALSISALPWVIIDRRGWAVVTLAFALAGYASLGIGGTALLPGASPKLLVFWASRAEIGPTPVFYVAIAANVLAMAVILLSPRSASPPPGRP